MSNQNQRGGNSNAGLFALGASLIGAAAGAGLALFFASQEKKQLEEELRDSERRKDEYREMSKSEFGECKICMDNPVDVALDPCGHTMCGKCAQLVSACPYCNRPIRRAKRIYLS